MNKIPLIGLDLDIIYDKLDNGLEIFVVPFKNTKNTYATFNTKYGSIHIEFIPNGEKKMIKVPEGIAHFLEHKMFEQEDGTDAFNFFSERGADANASTTYLKTSYLFSGTECVEENLNFLLDYVQSPYFTDENVRKEKGIIAQEIKMYQDNPYSRLREQALYNLFVNHPYKYSIAGTIKSVDEITKENLYEAYNTFYHPSNMFLVITGNIDENIIDIIKENQSKKKFSPSFKIRLKEYNEPNKVSKDYEEVKLNNVNLPKVIIYYKIDVSKINIDEIRLLNYIKLFFASKVGPTSDLCQTLKEEELITDNIYVSNEQVDNFMLISIAFESSKYKEVIERIEKELTNIEVEKKELERRKKVLASILLYGSDNVYAINDKIVSNIIAYGKVINDTMDIIKGLNIKEMYDVIKKISLKNKTICVVKNK